MQGYALTPLIPEDLTQNVCQLACLLTGCKLNRLNKAPTLMQVVHMGIQTGKHTLAWAKP